MSSFFRCPSAACGPLTFVSFSISSVKSSLDTKRPDRLHQQWETQTGTKDPRQRKKTCGPCRLAPPKVSKSLKPCCLLKDFCCFSYWPLVLSGEVHVLGTRGHHWTMAVKVLPWKANVATINSGIILGKKYWDSVPFQYPLPLYT